MLESEFKEIVKDEIRDRFPDLDLDFVTTISRSMPDMIILAPACYWAALEFKRSKNSPHRPNQDHHIERLRKKGYATFVYPENLEVVLDELEILFTP